MGLGPLGSERFWMSGRFGEQKGIAYLVKCFFFAALIFWVHGVMRLSVGEVYVGFLPVAQ